MLMVKISLCMDIYWLYFADTPAAGFMAGMKQSSGFAR